MLQVLVWLSISADVLVSGTSACPSPQMLSAALAEAMPDEEVAGSLRVDASPAGTLLSYTDASGGVRTRLLPEQGSCEEQATRAVVVLASWMSRPPGPSLAPVPVVLDDAPPPTPPNVHSWQLALAPLVGADKDGVSAGGRVDVTWRSSVRRIGWRAQLLGIVPRAVDVARWTYGAAGVSVSAVAWQTRALQLSLDAGPIVSLIGARGRTLDQPETDLGFAVGGNVGSRLSLPLGSVEAFADVRGLAWIVSPDLLADTSGGEVAYALPRATLQLAVGIAFSL